MSAEEVPLTLAALAETLPGSGRHFVYTLRARKPGVDLDDIDDHYCVYIGVTSNLRQRLRTHSRKWWAAAVDPAVCDFEDFPSREYAEYIESRAIRFNCPEMNRAGRLAVVEAL